MKHLLLTISLLIAAAISFFLLFCIIFYVLGQERDHFALLITCLFPLYGVPGLIGGYVVLKKLGFSTLKVPLWISSVIWFLASGLPVLSLGAAAIIQFTWGILKP